MNHYLLIVLIYFISVHFCLAQEWNFTYDASGNRIKREYSSVQCPPYQQSQKKGDDADENSSYANGQDDESPEDANKPGKSKSGNNEINESGNPGNTIIVNPNPSNGRFTVQIPKINISSITVYNVLGEIISYSPQVNGAFLFEIDLSIQPKGIYMVKVVSGEDIYIERIAIE